ncbi:MAG: preprotein translocase subunit SecG [Clostridia bacterium]|nr:preprotein translocase subunit SecG [Clostridia bacterium]
MNLLMFDNPEVVSDFVQTFIPIFRIGLLIVITICATILIISTLLQSSANPAGSSAIMGGATDSYLSHNKDNSRDGRLKRLTMWLASIIVVSVVLYFLTGIWLDFPQA